MRRIDFQFRCTDQTLLNDFNALKKGKQNLFSVWDNKGRLTPLPRTFVAALEPGDSLDTWSVRQVQNWKKVILSTGGAVKPVPYNVLSRFIQPASFPTFELVFTPSDDEALLSKAALEIQVTTVINGAGGPKYPFRVLTWQQANADPTLILLSSNYFGFYHTFITAANYQHICTAVGTDPLARQWPASLADALAIDNELGKSTDSNDGSQTSSLISAHKISAARGMRATVPSQKTVMGGKSATEVRAFQWLCAMMC